MLVNFFKVEKKKKKKNIGKTITAFARPFKLQAQVKIILCNSPVLLRNWFLVNARASQLENVLLHIIM